MFRRGGRSSGRGNRAWQEQQGFADTDEMPRVEPEISRDGPYDTDHAPQDDLHRLDLGSLRIPVIDGVQVQFQVDQSSGQLLSVTMTDGQSGMELAVFAAPKNSGLWDEVRGEITDSLRASQGGAQEESGPYGRELRLRLPTGTPGRFMPGRMLGIDGPRWFLRVVLTGNAALDDASAPLLMEALRRLVVVRGDQAMPLRDPLPLRLPKEITDHHDPEDQAGTPPGPQAPGVARTTIAMPTPGLRTAEIR